jgi:hypothetical protein
VGQQVLLNLTAGQLNLQETLASRRIRFWAVVDSAEGMQPTRRIFYEPAKTPIRKLLFELLGDIDDDALNSWSLSICPSPKRMASNPTGQDWGKTLCDVGIAFGSVLTLQRRLEVTEKEGAATA